MNPTDQKPPAEEPEPFKLKREFAPLRSEVWNLAGIRPHPALTDLNLLPNEEFLEELRSDGDELFDEPFLITPSGIVLQGIERLLIARERGVDKVRVVILTQSDDEALKVFLRHSRRRVWLNPFCCCELARTLKNLRREKAREHQRAGGRGKHLAKLSASEQIHVRGELSAIAGVSDGRFRQACELLDHGVKELIEDARRGALSIHGAWKISKLRADEQQREIRRRTTIRRQKRRVQLLARNDPKNKGRAATLIGQLLRILERLSSMELLANFRARFTELIADLEGELDGPVCKEKVETLPAA